MTVISAVSNHEMTVISSELERLAAVSDEKFSKYMAHAEGVHELARGFYECTLASFHLLQRERTDAMHLSQRLEITRDAVKRRDGTAALRQLRNLRARYAATRLHVEKLKAMHAALVARGSEVGQGIARDLDALPLLEDEALSGFEAAAFAGTALSAVSTFMGHAALTRVALGNIVRSFAAGGALGTGALGANSFRRSWKHRRHALGFRELGSGVLGHLGYHANETVGYLSGLEGKYDAVVNSLGAGVEVALGVTLDTLASDPLESFGSQEVDSLFDNLLTHVSVFRGAADDFIISFSEGKLPESLASVLPPPPSDGRRARATRCDRRSEGGGSSGGKFEDINQICGGPEEGYFSAQAFRGEEEQGDSGNGLDKVLAGVGDLVGEAAEEVQALVGAALGHAQGLTAEELTENVLSMDE